MCFHCFPLFWQWCSLGLVGAQSFCVRSRVFVFLFRGCVLRSHQVFSVGVCVGVECWERKGHLKQIPGRVKDSGSRFMQCRSNQFAG